MTAGEMIDQIAEEARRENAKKLRKRQAGEDILRAASPGPMAMADQWIAEDKEKERIAAGEAWEEAKDKARKEMIEKELAEAVRQREEIEN